jgi:OmpA-OmpF porin, OOP family
MSGRGSHLQLRSQLRAVAWAGAVSALVAGLSACAVLPRDVPTGVAGDAINAASAPAAGDRLARFARDRSAIEALGVEPSLAGDKARAQCFVQHAYSEWHENDRSGFTDAALDQAEAITAALQQRAAAPPTQLIAASDKLRPDLWAVADRHRGSTCAAASAGCLEVQLVRAAHEHTSIGWRHATSYFAIAEDLAARAEREAAACAAPAPAVAMPAPPPPAAVPPIIQREAMTLGADVLFRFNQSTAAQVLPAGLMQLDAAAAKLRGLDLRSVRVVGHTDPQGSVAYNQRLGLQRAETVKALLAARAVPAAAISTASRGASEPVTRCAKALKAAALRACNQPNRRVVIEFSYIAPQ